MSKLQCRLRTGPIIVPCSSSPYVYFYRIITSDLSSFRPLEGSSEDAAAAWHSVVSRAGRGAHALPHYRPRLIFGTTMRTFCLLLWSVRCGSHPVQSVPQPPPPSSSSIHPSSRQSVLLPRCLAEAMGDEIHCRWCEFEGFGIVCVYVWGRLMICLKEMSNWVHLTLLLPLHLLTYFTLWVNLTPAIKTSRKLLDLILFPKFKCEVLYVCLLTT